MSADYILAPAALADIDEIADFLSAIDPEVALKAVDAIYDGCDREAMSFVATTAGVTGEDVRDLMVAAVEHRFGRVTRLPRTIEWLTDNGSCYLARETRRFAKDVGLVPRTTPLESPQSNGMAEAFVRTLKRDYVRVSPLPDAETVLRQLPGWVQHYNEVHPHRALRYRSPREFIAQSTLEDRSGT